MQYKQPPHSWQRECQLDLGLSKFTANPIKLWMTNQTREGGGKKWSTQYLDEMLAALLSNLDECVARHVLNPIVRFWMNIEGKYVRVPIETKGNSSTKRTVYIPCINSNSLLTTVFKNFQWARRNLGYWPTTYMMFDAMIALLSLPRFCSQSPSKSWCIQKSDNEHI